MEPLNQTAAGSHMIREMLFALRRWSERADSAARLQPLSTLRTRQRRAVPPVSSHLLVHAARRGLQIKHPPFRSAAPAASPLAQSRSQSYLVFTVKKGGGCARARLYGAVSLTGTLSHCRSQTNRPAHSLLPVHTPPSTPPPPPPPPPLSVSESPAAWTRLDSLQAWTSTTRLSHTSTECTAPSAAA